MKLFNAVLFLLIINTSCEDSESKNQLSEKEKLYAEAETELSDQKEKIVLLSAIKKISYDTIFSILKDYYSHTSEYSSSSDSSRFFSEKAMELISKKYQISINKVASVIFSFKYEMLSKDEIIEEFIEDENAIQYEGERQEPL